MADTLIRKKAFRLQAEQREKFSSYEAALKEVLTNHKYLWNDARTKALLSRVDHRKEADSAPSDRVTEDNVAKPSSPKAAKRKRKLARLRDELARAKSNQNTKTVKTDKPSSAADRDKRIPESEWKLINKAAQNVKGAKRCHYFNSSMGCSLGDKCRFKHACMECGSAHSMVGHH